MSAPIDLKNDLFVIDPEGYDLWAIRAAAKATEGTDLITNVAGEHHIVPTAANVIALWASGLDWTPSAMKRAFDIVVPLARRELVLEKMHRS